MFSLRYPASLHASRMHMKAMESHVSPQSFSVILDQVVEFRIGRVYIVLAAESAPAGVVQEPRRRHRQGTWKGDLHPRAATPFHHLSKPRQTTYYCLFQHTRTVSRALPRRFLRPKAVISQQSPCAATNSGDAGRSYSVSWNVVTYPTQQQDQRESWPAGDADASSFFGSLSALLVRISSMTPRSSASATLRYLSRSIISLTSSILYLS